MKPSTRNGLIIGGLALAGIGILAYFKKQWDLVYNACYTIAGGVVHTLGFNNVNITLFFKVVNESDITIELSDMVFNIYVNKMFVSKVLKPDVQMLYSKSNAIIKIDFQFNPKDLLRAGLTNIESILYDKDKLIITTKGTFSAKTGIVKLRNFPFDESITLTEIMTPSTAPKKC